MPTNMTTPTKTPMKKAPVRSLAEIAQEINANWKTIYFGAVPYLQAMATMDKVDGQYGEDPGDMIVRYFLSNATSWRGDVARRVKAELKGML